MKYGKHLKMAVTIALAGVVIIGISGCNVPEISNLFKKPEAQKTVRIIPEKPIPSVSEGIKEGPKVIVDKPLTLNKTGQAGCLVCHADKKAVMVVDGVERSIYVDRAMLKKSPHKKISCLDCHIDFSYTHEVRQASYKKIASLACKNCHDHSKENTDYRESAHGKAALSGNAKAATCGDCHGSHEILRIKSSKADKLKFRTQAETVCGKCHKDYWNSYNDYYHGRAYKRGAEDAPPCWDCHGAHKILPAKDATSKVAKSNIGDTCGICHPGSTDKLADYVPLIHGKKKERAKNIVFKYVDKGLDYLNKPGAEGKPEKEKAGGNKLTDTLHKVRLLFFPDSLRPKD